VTLEPFAHAVGRKDAQIDLARACLMIAQDAYPALDIGRYLGEIEGMAVRLRARMPQSPDAEERIVALNEFLFEDLGYRGNTDDYYDPRNSYLNDVLERKTGIPITLSVLYMELGRRVGLPLEGVSFPGHFLVRAQVRGGVIVLDPFAAGLPQSEGHLPRARQAGAAARGAEPHPARRPGGRRRSPRPRLCLPPPGVLAARAEGPHRVPRARARRARPRRRARQADGAADALRPDELRRFRSSGL
jgi:hypothetical protein